MVRTGLFLCVLCTLCVLCASEARVISASEAGAQEPPAPQTVSTAQFQAAIARLGNLDYSTRTTASRTIRRTASAQAVPALLQAVSEQPDGYVRYRALVLLTGFNDPRTKDAMRESLASPNDRLRTVAYGFLFYAYGMVLTQSFNGAGDTWTPTIINLFVFWLWELPLAYALAIVFGMGPRGVFLAIMIAFSTLAVVSAVVFRRGRWKTRVV